MVNDMDSEVWKPVVGFESAYEVSNFGRVRSKNRMVRTITHGKEYLRSSPMRVLKPYLRNGYELVPICVNGKSRWMSVHRLVLDSFIEPRSFPEFEVNHKDTNKRNNRLENLEWCTKSENMKHAISCGLVAIPKRWK